MKLRDVVIFSGAQFTVPQGIQRIDHRATHGWQLRYGGTKLFSDHTSDGSGAAASLEAATKELLKRIARLPAPVRLQQAPSENKSSDLPAGIFGPVIRQRRDSHVRDASLSVLVPRFGAKPLRRTIYIGTENTYTPERYERALAKAIAMRAAAEEAYQRAATRAKRQESLALKDGAARAPAPAAKKAARSTVQSVAKSATNSAAKSAAKSVAKSATKPTAKTAARTAKPAGAARTSRVAKVA